MGGAGGATTAGTGGGGVGSISPSGALSPSHQQLQQGNPFGSSGGRDGNEGQTATNLNENLKNIGKFFRRDLGGFGGRFGKGDG